MIPKKIHFFWYNVGKRKPSFLNLRCMESWKRVLPDWEFVDWSTPERVSSIQHQFFQDGIATGTSACLATCSEFVRYYALYTEGGVYVDCDLELIKEPDISPKCWLGFQRVDIMGDCINSSVMGSEPGHEFMGQLSRSFDNNKNFRCGVHFCVTLPTRLLRERGLYGLNEEQMVGDILIYSRDRYYPWWWEERPQWSRITDKTYGIHWWEGSWVDETYK